MPSFRVIYQGQIKSSLAQTIRCTPLRHCELTTVRLVPAWLFPTASESTMVPVAVQERLRKGESKT